MPPATITDRGKHGPDDTPPMLYSAFDNPTAETSSSGGTSVGSVVWKEGNVKADTQPARNTTTAMPSGVTPPVPTHQANPAAIVADNVLR